VPISSAYADEAVVEWYDIAFDWRRDKEADFVEACLREFGKKTEGGVLDLACGGGQFLLEMQRRGWRVAGVDLSPQMIDRARRRVTGPCILELADMSEFALSEAFDVATCWLDSLPYLQSNEEIVRHLQCVGRVLTGDGLYLVDMGFSSWADSMWTASQDDWRPHSYEGWCSTRGETEVYHDGWYGPPCNGLAHLCTEYLHFRVRDLSTGTSTERTFGAWKRSLHPQELAALVSASNVFEVVEWFSGSFALDQTLKDKGGRGRGLVLLRKRDAEGVARHE
jgi:SAM-dependent methyltransferase